MSRSITTFDRKWVILDISVVNLEKTDLSFARSSCFVNWFFFSGNNVSFSL